VVNTNEIEQYNTDRLIATDVLAKKPWNHSGSLGSPAKERCKKKRSIN
jgi:hypothetical protein